MKLILLSKHFIEPAQEALRDFTGKKNSEITLAFCSNAGDVYDAERRDYIDISRQELVSAGYQLIDLDLTKPYAKITEVLKLADATFFTGGSFYRLMKLFNDSGLSQDYKQLLERGLVHIGFSAGAMICGPDFKGHDSFAQFKEPSVTKALDFFPYYIIPHYFDKFKYTKAFEDTIKNGFEKVIPLTNQQGIIVEGKEWRIVQTDQS